MSEVQSGGTFLRRMFGKTKEVVALPNLIEVQSKSFNDFVQLDYLPSERLNIGLEKVLRAMAESGKLAKDTDFDMVARELLTMVNGIAVQAGFDPADWPAERQHKLLMQAIAPLVASR